NVQTRNDKTSELYNRYTEMTTENTKEMTTENLTPLPPLPHFLNPELWQDFLNYQKERGRHFSAMGVDMCFRDWTKWHNEGIDVNECIRTSMRNGYKGVFKTQAQNKSTQINLDDYVKFGLDPTLLGGFIETKEAEWIECK
ncbi:hypothetical protein, partial [Campylobacter mucosalis]|uniref:hypothetical protein n=2 Tax=Campylobacter mucosalis TaxID=202 RepID=UPI001B8D7857